MNFRYRKEINYALAFVFVGILYFGIRAYFGNSIDLIPALLAAAIFVLMAVMMYMYLKMY